jgi:CDP-diacylglycerol--glycerol-3-phosphate 3-phosphatidyltransferase
MSEARGSGKGRRAQIPNILSLCRVFIIPILVVLLLFPGRGVRALAAALFVLASITDYLDGYLARKYKVVSSMGTFLDPMADKVLVMAVLVMLLPLKEGSVPAWMVVVILGREIIISGLRSAASARGVVIQAAELGKFKTILQIFALTGLLLHYRYLFLDFHLGGMYFLWAAMILGVWSGVDYFLKFWALVAKEQAEPGRQAVMPRPPCEGMPARTDSTGRS